MSWSYKMVEGVCYQLNKLPGGGVKALMLKGAEKNAQNDQLPKFVYQRNVKVKQVSYNGFGIFRLQARDMDKKEKRAILFLPGGGGMTRATALHYDTAIRIAKETGIPVYILNYPLAPDYTVRDALNWLEDVYAGFLKKRFPEDLILMGDSAGANLILSLTHRLKRKPGKLVVISPACGLEYGKNREIRKAMEPKDPILSVEMNDIIAENWCKKVPLDDPDVSPEYIDYKDFPPMLLLYGTHELFYPHVARWLKHLKEQKVVYQEIQQPMCHDWALCSFFPEGRDGMHQMAQWMKGIL